jgi:hypothetical protein
MQALELKRWFLFKKIWERHLILLQRAIRKTYIRRQKG